MKTFRCGTAPQVSSFAGIWLGQLISLVGFSPMRSAFSSSPGCPKYDKDIANEARKALATLPELLKVEYVLGLPQTELMELMAREPASSIVLYLTQFRDREGRPYTSRDVLRAMSAVSPAPIYSFVRHLPRLRHRGWNCGTLSQPRARHRRKAAAVGGGRIDPRVFRSS